MFFGAYSLAFCMKKGIFAVVFQMQINKQNKNGKPIY